MDQNSSFNIQISAFKRYIWLIERSNLWLTMRLTISDLKVMVWILFPLLTDHTSTQVGELLASTERRVVSIH